MQVQLPQPYWEAPDGRQIAFAGRLDNQSALRSRFGDPSLPRDLHSSYLAWQAWSAGRLDLLLGDWILAVWAPDERRLWLACDPIGTKRLFYRREGERVLLSPSLRPLLHRLDTWDQAYLYRFLLDLPLGSATPLQAIRLVPRGRLLEVTPDEERLGPPFWNPWREGPLRLANPGEYVEQFRSLLTEAVRVRLAAAGPKVGITLSGGLDSGSVGALAAHLMERGELPQAQIHAIFYRYDVAEAAEESYLKANAARMGVEPEIILAESMIRSSWTDPPVVGTDLPVTNLMGWPIIVEAARRFRAAGVQTILTGRGGDALLAGYPEGVLDLLGRGRLVLGLRHLRTWANEFHIGPLLLLRRLLQGRSWSHLAADQPDWFHAHPEGETLSLPAVPTWVSRAQRAAHADFWSAMDEGGSAMVEFGLTESWPLGDQRLLEFTFRIDRSLLQSPTETKSLLREAMRGILPEQVRQRRSKSFHTGISLAWFRRQRPFMEELLHSSVGAAFDFLRPETVREQLRLTSQGQYHGLLLLNLYALLVWMAEAESEVDGRDLRARDGGRDAGLSPALRPASGGGQRV